MGLNLHNIVSTALNSVQEMEEVYIYKCLGIRNNYGDIIADYSDPIKCQARIQQDSDEALEHIDNINSNMILRKFYLNTEEYRVSEVNRLEQKQADYIYRISSNEWYMVNATYDDFSKQGWVCVRGVLQNGTPINI